MAIANIGADTRNFYGLLVDTSGDSYEVPPYQRDYAWDKDQWADYWSDVIEVVKEHGEHVHFMGAMVFLLKADNVWWVLDGQQRFSTLMIFLAALRDAIDSLDPVKYLRERGKVQDLMAPEVPGSFPRVRAQRLTLNRRDNALFSRIVSGDDVPQRASRDWQRSEKQILNAYKYFLGQFNEELRSERWSDPERFIAAMERALTHRLCHIRVEIKDQVNAQAVFEALNNRGVELTQADLIKNYLFMEIESSPADLQEAMETWEKVVQLVGEDDLAMLLRYYWNSAYSFVRMDELQRTLAKKVSRSNANVMAFIRQLHQEASLFATLRKGNGGDWVDVPTAKALAALKTLGLRASYVLLLALCAEDRSTSERRKAVKALLAFSVRYYTVGGQSANTMETQYSEWAIDLRVGRMTNADLIGRLRALGGARDTFLRKFEMLSVKDANTAKYLLREINDAIWTERRVPLESQEVLELEHIIPQSLTDEWIRMVRVRDENVNPEDLLYRFGNLTLLEKRFNIAGSNHPLEIKRERAYDMSALPTNEDLRGTVETPYEFFGPPEVLDRERAFAPYAERIWSL